MIRITIDIEEYGTIEGTKECVAMALDHLGKVRVVSVHTGKEKEKKWEKLVVNLQILR